MAPTGERHRMREALTLGIISFTIFLLLRSQVHSYDALMFAYAIDLGVFADSVFRPHNLLYLPLAIAVGRLTGLDPFLSGQLVSALFGGASVSVFWLLARRIAPYRVALFTTLFFFTTNAVFCVATWVEVYTTSLFFVLLCAFLLARRTPCAWLVGIAWGMAILSHITNVLLVVPLAVWCLSRARRGAGGQFLAGILCGASFLSAFVYTGVAWFFVGVRSPGEFILWIVSYTATQSEYGSLRPSQLLLAGLGLKRALVDGPAGVLMVAHGYVIGAAVTLAVSSRGIARRIAVCLLVFFLTYAAFFAWWEPLNIEFWVVTLVPLMFLCLLGFRALRSRRALRRRVLAIAAAALAVQFALNGARTLRDMDPGRDFWMTEARAIAACLNDEDVVITFNDPLVFALPLAADRPRIVPLEMLVEADSRDFDRVEILLRIELYQVEGLGGTPYVYTHGLSPPRGKLDRFALTPEEYKERLGAILDSDLTTSSCEGRLWR